MDTEAVLALMKDVAARVITPRFRRLAAGEVMEKNPGDLVTVADREAEELLTAGLLAGDSDALVVGEEACAADPELLDQLAEAPNAYLVDPVDGTKNFVHGRPNHAVIVAQLHFGECVRGWIWQPEFGHAYVVERGRGITRDGVPLTRSSVTSPTPADLRVVTSRPASEGRHGDLTFGPTAWCCGVDYPWLVEDRVDAILYTRALPWDHAAGSLFAHEVGGVARHLDGSPYSPGHGHRHNGGHLLIAADPTVWELVAERVRS